MGFGILFFGYFISFLLSLNLYGPFFALVGNYVIFIAIKKLSEYKHSLVRCIPSLILLAICNLLECIKIIVSRLIPVDSDFFSILGEFLAQTSATSSIISTLALIATLTFNVFLFLSIISLSDDTGTKEIKSLSITNIFVVSVFFTANITALILSGIFEIQNAYISVSVILLRIIFPLFALALIYRCFRLICAPEDVDVPIKPSRFKFVNEFRERQALKEEESRAAREELLKKHSKDTTATSHHAKKSKKKK